ncbi:UMP kinase [Candidatus Pacearchaeota archaeon]|nr:UMP kinase [Candidatus Pacearchaeota archaeon]
MKNILVLSLGGSLIIPSEINLDFLKNFRELINKNKKKYKFVIVCGGGSVSRKYIQALAKDNKSEYLQNLIGISVTRLNARFMSYFFNKDPEKGIPQSMKDIKNLLERNDIVFCGALRYSPDQTSDATACKIAAYLHSDFVNLTNVKGLYDKNPKEPGAKFIPKATIAEFNKIVMSIPNKPGMHAPVDHVAMKVIKTNKIKTYILGPDLSQFQNLLNNKDFIGTIIE